MNHVLPAYAGMIPPASETPSRGRCAPRVCGDDPGSISQLTLDRYVLPAYAGMIRSRASAGLRSRRAPRVCGDDPTLHTRVVHTERCSPRMRG